MTLAGVFLGALAGGLYTVSRMFTRMIYQVRERPMSELELNFLIHVVVVVLFIPLICMNRQVLCVSRELRWTMFWMTVGANAYGIFVALALSAAPVGDVTAIIMAGNGITALLGYLALKETLGWLDAASGIIGFGGILILARPTFIFGPETGNMRNKFDSSSSLGLVAVVFALLTTFSVSVFSVSIRKWTLEGGKTLTAVILPYFIGLPLSFLVMLPDYTRILLDINWMEVAYLIGASITWDLGLLVHVLALKLEDAFVVGVARNVDIVVGFLLQYFIMHEIVTVWKISGSAIIIFSFLLLVFKRLSLKKIVSAFKASTLNCDNDTVQKYDVASSKSEY